jgi:hypothetical protein
LTWPGESGRPPAACGAGSGRAYREAQRDIPVDLDAIRADAPHEDLRDWLATVDALGDLRVLERSASTGT